MFYLKTKQKHLSDIHNNFLAACSLGPYAQLFQAVPLFALFDMF